MYSIIIHNNAIIEARKDGNGIAIPESQYYEILDKVRNKPQAEEGYAYILKADTLEWEPVELPPVPETDPTPEEALNILLGGAL